MIALHLLRHAHAGDPAKWSGPDEVRPLSDRGRRQCERVGRVLATVDEAPDLFLTSPRLRASQTADIVARAVGARVVVDERLAESLDVTSLARILESAGDAARPCLVGHDPDFSDLLGELIGVPAIGMRKGAIARIDIDSARPAPGSGILRFLVPPELLPAS